MPNNKEKNKSLIIDTVILSSGYLFEKLGFFGVLATLAFYTQQNFALSVEASNSMYGLYAMLSLCLPVLGGLIADKILDPMLTIFIGYILTFLGSTIIIFFSSQLGFSIGLSTFLMGIGLCGPNIANIIGNISTAKNSQHNAYQIFYVTMNIGAIIGPIIFGMYGQKTSFLIISIGLLGSWICLLLIQKKLKLPHQQHKVSHYILVAIICFVAISYTTLSLYLYYLSLYSVGALLIFIAILAKYTINSANSHERKSLLNIATVFLYTVIFFSASLQVGNAVTSLIAHHINLNILHYHIPTSFFVSLDPLFVVLMAPVMGALLKKQRIATMAFPLSIILAGIGMLIFSLTANIQNSHIASLLITIGMLFLGAGEITISPTALKAIKSSVPQKFSSRIFSFWYFSIAISGYISGVVDNLQSRLGDSKYFLLIGASMIIIALFLAKIESGHNNACQ